MSKLRERFVMKLVYVLPRSLVYWCAIRLIANATTGIHENQVVPELTAMDALKRWETAKPTRRRFKVWNGPDYRVNSTNDAPRVKEINFIGRVWDLRLLVPFGISIWRNNEQKFRVRYPALG